MGLFTYLDNENNDQKMKNILKEVINHLKLGGGLFY